MGETEAQVEKMTCLASDHWLTGSESSAVTPVFACQMPCLGGLPVPQWYVLVSPLQTENGYSKGQTSPFIPLAQSLVQDVLAE